MEPVSTLHSYTYTYTSFSPGIAYSCSTYRADLSTKYGICKSLRGGMDSGTLDLASIFVYGISVGNIVSGLFLLLCVVGMLCLLKWAMNQRVKRRKWSWGLDPVGTGGARVHQEARRGKARQTGWWLAGS